MPDRQARIARLKALVEVHGGDRERWPASDRLDMARLIAEDAGARAIVAEAQALDRVLDRAPGLDAGRLEDLTHKIVAAARTEGRWQGDAAEAARDRAYQGKARLGGEATAGGRISPEPPADKSWWLAAMLHGPGRGPVASVAMLAASLVMGVLIGFSATSADLGTSTQNVAETGIDSVAQQLVLGEDSLDTVIEDLL